MRKSTTPSWTIFLRSLQTVRRSCKLIGPRHLSQKLPQEIQKRFYRDTEATQTERITKRAPVVIPRLVCMSVPSLWRMSIQLVEKDGIHHTEKSKRGHLESQTGQENLHDVSSFRGTVPPSRNRPWNLSALAQLRPLT